MMFKKLQNRYPSAEFIQKSKTLIVNEEDIFEAVKSAFDFGAKMLLDITVIDYLDYMQEKGETPLQKERFALVYVLRSYDFKEFVVLKTYLKEPKCKSITCIYKSANWIEREAYDQYGVVFEGHPNLVRILNH